MEKCKINFNGASKQLAEGIYSDLMQKGVSCSDFDGGYAVTNYAGIHCPDKNSRNCLKGKGDGIVEAEEVLEYVFNNHEKYRDILEGRIGDKLPWLLDDFDPSTRFDATIRAQVQNAIIELKKILAGKGIPEGSSEHDEKLAVGLHWLVAFPPKNDNFRVSAELMIHAQQRMKADDLEDFLIYLTTNGGMGITTTSEEYTALEALRNYSGNCTEVSKILFGVLKEAKLKPIFINEDILNEKKTKDPLIKSLIKTTSRGDGHMCIGIYTHERLRLLDPSTINSDADYEHYTPLTPRQYLSYDYANQGSMWSKNEKWEMVNKRD